MRWARALVPPVLMLALVACGTSSATDGGNGNGDQETATPAATESAAASEGGGGGGGGGGSSDDLDALVDDLTPPNATESTRTSASGGIFVGWESTDSVDSLKSFYENAIPATGMQIFSTTSASGGYIWVFAESEGSSHGGSVTIAPSGSGSGTAVIVTVTGE